jgi:hypothetical protein
MVDVEKALGQSSAPQGPVLTVRIIEAWTGARIRLRLALTSLPALFAQSQSCPRAWIDVRFQWHAQKAA